MDDLAKKYKEQYPEMSDQGCQIQALLNRFAASNPVGFKQTELTSGCILLESDKNE